MRAAAVLTLAGCGFTGPSAVGPGTVDAAPGFAKQISIHATHVGSELHDFPMLFAEVADADLVGRAAGEVGFVDATGAALPVEIERFDPTSGAIAAWVRVPVLADAAPTQISLVLGPRPATSVWDAAFAGVYHFADGAGAASLDSTPHHHDGMRVGAPQIAAGIIGSGLTFTNTGTYVDLGTAISLAGPFTISLWTRAATDTPQAYGRLVSRCDATPVRNGVTLEQNMPAGYAYATRSSTATIYATDATPLATAAPSFVAVTFDGAALTLFENGRANVVPDARVLQDPISPLTIGAELYAPGNPGDGYQGLIDEVRFSTVARALAWQQAELANTGSPATFYDVLGKSTVNVEP